MMRRNKKPPVRLEGAALIVVLMALAVLFSLGVPFLFASRMRSEASNEAYSRTMARIAVESASRATAFHQAMTHPSIDPTPLWDQANEWDGTAVGPMPQSLGSDWERSTESWGSEIESLQSRVSLATAPVMLLQNLIHPCYLNSDITYRDSEITVTSTAGFPDQGFVLIGTRWTQYGSKTATSFKDLVPDGTEPDDLDSLRFREGTLVQDPRVQSLVLANFHADGHAAPEFLDDVFGFDFGLGPDALLPEAELRILEQLCALQTGGYGSDRWEPATWTTRRIDPELPDVVTVDEGTFFNTGTIVRFLPDDGAPLDRLVIAAGGGNLKLAAPLPITFSALTTRAYPMRREPVDINACRPEILEALATGVAFRGNPPVVTDYPASGRGGREWVTPHEGRAFALQVMQARPLRGPQDLWDRVLAPMAAGGTLSDHDAWALYLNSIDPNNGALKQSTTSFGYRTGNQFLNRINAAVRSRLGRTLARASFRQGVAAAPAGELLSMHADQVTFEDFGRWNRGLHGVTTLPFAMGQLTGQFDAEDHSALTLQLGTLEQVGRNLPDPDPELSAVIPLPARETDAPPFNGRGRTEHFDFEPSPLGRYIPAAGTYSPPLEDWGVTDDSGLSNVEPLCFQGWFYAEDLSAGTLFELSAFDTDRNRVTATLEDSFLVVRVNGTVGPDAFDLAGIQEEITIRVDPADYSLADRWFHVSVLIRDLSHRGIQVMVDGVPRGEVEGFTYLTQAMSGYAPGDSGGTISVESTEGFPDRGVIRIGEEVMEYVSKTETSFVLDRDESNEYFGGRAVREPTDPHVLLLDTTHPEGSAVELYGYSAIMVGDMPPGGHALSGDVGPWSYGNVIEGPEEIIGQHPSFGRPLAMGTGFSSTYVGDLELGPLIGIEDDHYYAEAFQSDGGFAVIWTANVGSWENIDDGSQIGGLEIVRYSARNDTTLTLSERNVRPPGVANAPEDDPDNWSLSSTGVSFVTEWTINSEDGDLNEEVRTKVYIAPISLHANGASEVTYGARDEEFSRFVQLSSDGSPNTLEWVRYDNIVDGHFVRDDWTAILTGLLSAYFASYDGTSIVPPGPGDAGGGIGIGGAGGRGNFTPEPKTSNLQDPVTGLEGRATIGQPLDDRNDAIDFTSQEFHFRGVLGTYEHAHTAGEEFVPVFTTQRQGITGFNLGSGYGFVGRFDRVAVMQEAETALPFWYTVSWSNVPLPTLARVQHGLTYAAFTASTGIPYTGHAPEELTGSLLGEDRRQYSRICKFPNHERPQNLGNLVVGGTTSGQERELEGYADEVSFVAVGGQGDPALYAARGAFLLQEDLTESDTDNVILNAFDITVDGFRISEPGIAAGDWLGAIYTSGLLDIDGEIIAYSELDRETGEFTIATDGRGFLGSEIRGHSAGTLVRVVDGRAASALDNDLGPNDESIQVANQAGFPRTGMLLIDDEIVHAPMRGGGGYLSMPRTRRSADGVVGHAILRGRFGTETANHQSGAMVYSFPTRWMDNYIERNDSGVGAWMQLGFHEPDALWRRISYESELPDSSHSVRLLARGGPANWEDDPRNTPGLKLFDSGTSLEGGFLPLGIRSDQLDLRVMFDWGVGSFDTATFSAVGWTQAPRLRNLMVDYMATSRVSRDQEVVE